MTARTQPTPTTSQPALRRMRVAVRRDTDPQPADWRPIARLDAEGVTVPSLVSTALGRYVWLDLQLGDGEPVRALGEVAAPRDPALVAIDIRFKHLFPDDRRRLLAVLQAATP